MRIFARRELYWQGDRLFRWGSDALLAEVVPDDRWPGMWRVRMDGRLSDMANLSRARDAAMAAALTELNRGRHQETALGTPYRGVPASGLPGVPLQPDDAPEAA
jgi:hypothetical protein